MQSESFDGAVGGEYNGVGLVEMYEIFVTQDDFFAMQWYLMTESTC